MTYRGHIKNGVVVLDGSIQLPEGTEVQIEALHDASTDVDQSSSPTLYERLEPFIGSAQGLPPDASRNLKHYLYGHSKGSPQAILEILRQPPHLLKEDVDALEESIRAGKLQPRSGG